SSPVALGARCGIGLLGLSASESGRLRLGAGGYPRADRRRSVLMLPTLTRTSVNSGHLSSVFSGRLSSALTCRGRRDGVERLRTEAPSTRLAAAYAPTVEPRGSV